MYFNFGILVITSKLVWEKKLSQRKRYVFYSQNKSLHKSILLEIVKLHSQEILWLRPTVKFTTHEIFSLLSMMYPYFS